MVSILGLFRPRTSRSGISYSITLDIDGQKAPVPLVAPANDAGLRFQNGDLAFDLQDQDPVYLLQSGNSRAFKSVQKTLFALPNASELKAEVSGHPSAEAATLYIFLCDAAGAPIVRKALKIAQGDVAVFTRPAKATQAFVALRLIGQGSLEPLVLSIFPASRKGAIKSDINPFFTAALTTLLRNEQDDLLLEYLSSATGAQGKTGRIRYLGVAANQAARAKRFGVEARCLEMLNDTSPGANLQQKIARAYHRDANYSDLADVLARWPHVLQTTPQTPFHQGAAEISAAAELAESFDVPHAERYRARTTGPRVAYLLHNALPYASGGYATRGHGLMRGLLSAGGAGSVLARPGFPLDTKSGMDIPEGSSMRRIDGVTYRFENSFGRKGLLFRYMLKAGDYFAETAPRNTTVIQAASNFYTGMAGAHAAFRRKQPFVYEIRGFWELTRQSRDASFAETALYLRNRRLEQCSAHLADHVLTLTPSMKREIESWGVPPERISLAPNAVDADVFVPGNRDAKLAERLGLTPDNLVIGYIGSFVDYEGLDMLLEASLRLIAKDDRVRLMIVGDDTPGGKAAVPVGAQLRAQAAASGLGDKILFTGRIPHDEVPAHYSLIDICPFPRRPVPVCEMVSPMKPLEAMAMGKCVIVSSVGGMEGMVRHGETGLIFRKGDPDALYAALRKARDPELRARLGAEARKWVSKERSWKNVGASVADLHAALVTGDAGFRRRPEAYDDAMKRFREAFPMRPVIDAAQGAIAARHIDGATVNPDEDIPTED